MINRIINFFLLKNDTFKSLFNEGQRRLFLILIIFSSIIISSITINLVNLSTFNFHDKVILNFLLCTATVFLIYFIFLIIAWIKQGYKIEYDKVNVLKSIKNLFLFSLGFYLTTFFGIFLEDIYDIKKNDATLIEDTLISDQQDKIESIRLPNYNNIDSNTIIFISQEQMKTYELKSNKLILKEYANKLCPNNLNWVEVKKINIPEISQDVLFIQYFSGGAHCCYGVQSFRHSDDGTFKYVDEFGGDGDLIELEYPFKVKNSSSYFYCSYATHFDYACEDAKYREKIYIDKNYQFYSKYFGDKLNQYNCIKNYIKNVKFPDLNDGQDGGEREKLLNLLTEYYNLGGTFNEIHQLYNSIEYVEDKRNLWIEIFKYLNKQNTYTDQEILLRYPISENLNIKLADNINSINIDTDCEELMKTVIHNGDEIDELLEEELNNSEALNYIALFKYNSKYYAIVEFTSSSKRYVYCDLTKSNWNNFKDSDEYGEAFHQFIKPISQCDCGE